MLCRPICKREVLRLRGFPKRIDITSHAWTMAKQQACELGSSSIFDISSSTMAIATG